jgi:hypothetical protein
MCFNVVAPASTFEEDVHVASAADFRFPGDVVAIALSLAAS